MRYLTVAMLVLALAALAACGDRGAPERPETPVQAIQTPGANELAEAYVSRVRALVELLEGIHDRASAQAAAPHIPPALEEALAHLEAVEALPEEEQIGEQYGQILALLDGHLRYQLRRVTLDEELAAPIHAAFDARE